MERTELNDVKGIRRWKSGDDKGKFLEACRVAVAEKSAQMVDGVLLDLFSASAVVAVYDALNEENREKFLNLSSFKKIVSVACKLSR